MTRTKTGRRGDGGRGTHYDSILAVTESCRDAREYLAGGRPLSLNHDAVTFDTTDAPTVCVRAVRPYISLLVLLYCSERSSARNEPCTAAADYWSHLATCEICGVEVSVLAYASKKKLPLRQAVQ